MNYLFDLAKLYLARQIIHRTTLEMFPERSKDRKPRRTGRPRNSRPYARESLAPLCPWPRSMSVEHNALSTTESAGSRFDFDCDSETIEVPPVAPGREDIPTFQVRFSSEQATSFISPELVEHLGLEVRHLAPDPRIEISRTHKGRPNTVHASFASFPLPTTPGLRHNMVFCKRKRDGLLACLTVAGLPAAWILLNFNQSHGKCPAPDTTDGRWLMRLPMTNHLPHVIKCPSLPIYILAFLTYSAVGIIHLTNSPRYWPHCGLLAIITSVAVGTWLGPEAMLDSVILGGSLSLLCAKAAELFVDSRPRGPADTLPLTKSRSDTCDSVRCEVRFGESSAA
ncbi:hypothetical protein QBC47DRAFT_187084 [Echria macrotheca]|uniref:Uncharacterized protein n=1 Tax=Echria macrotheca TaxID=438768 RepID=A0AAJ0BDW6_9PEZI|nr:hypothetical protein QBC47DRAFT_187084 [Echria macrotheca]